MQQTTRHNVAFTGKAGEFFGIWIVNILLSIVTLGIYSAWAKVRTNRYLYQHTAIDDRRFDYHATGLQILIGRVIVVVALVAFSLLSSVPVLVPILGVLYIAGLPWLLNRSLAFNARVTSWSGLRLGFEGSYGGAFKVYLLYPFLSVFTLYLTLPMVIRAQRAYVTRGHFYGTARFSFESPLWPFYRAFLMAGLWFVGAFIAVGIMVSLNNASLVSIFEGDAVATNPVLTLIVYVVFIAAILPAAYIYQAYVRNAVYAAMALEEGHRFHSDVNPLGMVGIALTNAAAVIVSLGLLLPWARIRMLRYLCAHTFVDANGSLDAFTGQQQQEVGAVGDAFSDIEGIELGLPI